MNMQKDIHQPLAEELKISKKSQCSHIVACYDSFYHDGDITLVLEYMDRGSLVDILEQVKTILEPYVAALCKKVLQGLLYLHNVRDVIHRSIKPSNLLINQKGDVKIMHFGLSTMRVDSVVQGYSYLKTYGYMAPERISGRTYDSKSDIWSLGMVTLECVTGRSPYVRLEDPQCYPSLNQFLGEIVEGPAPSAPPDQFSPEFCSFISGCLQKDPTNRSSTQELLNHPFIQKFEDKDVDLGVLVANLKPRINFAT